MRPLLPVFVLFEVALPSGAGSDGRGVGYDRDWVFAFSRLFLMSRKVTPIAAPMKSESSPPFRSNSSPGAFLCTQACMKALERYSLLKAPKRRAITMNCTTIMV